MLLIHGPSVRVSSKTKAKDSAQNLPIWTASAGLQIPDIENVYVYGIS